MTTIKVDVRICWNNRFTTMFHNITLDMTNFGEINNRNMERAFAEQHPVLLSRIPTRTEKWSGVTYRAGYWCKVLE